jgi:hypothetical protein
LFVFFLILFFFFLKATIKLPTATQAAPRMNIMSGKSMKEQLERFLMDMFTKYGVCNVNFLKQNLASICKTHENGVNLFRFFFLIEVLDAANLLTNVTDDFFRQVLNSIASSLHNAYFLKNLDNPTLDKVIQTLAYTRFLKLIFFLFSFETVERCGVGIVQRTHFN